MFYKIGFLVYMSLHCLTAVAQELSQDRIFSEELNEVETSTKYPYGVNVIPGQAHIDYPLYHTIPESSFSCNGRAPGFYADPEHRCQVWHVCDMRSRQVSFLCTNGTIFSQEKRVCDWWYKVDCDAESVNRNYALNSELWVENEEDKQKYRYDTDNEEQQFAQESSYTSLFTTTTKRPKKVAPRRQTVQPTNAPSLFTTLDPVSKTTLARKSSRRTSPTKKPIVDLKSPKSKTRVTTVGTTLPTQSSIPSVFPGLPAGHKIVVRVNPNSALGKLSDDEIKAHVLKKIKEQIARGIVPTSARTEHIPLDKITTTPKPKTTKNPKVLLVVPQHKNGEKAEPFYVVEKKKEKSPKKKSAVSFKPDAHDPATEKRFRHSTPRKHSGNVQFISVKSTTPKAEVDERQVLSESQRRPAFPYSFNGFHRLEAVTGKTIYPDKVVELEDEPIIENANEPSTTGTTKPPRRNRVGVTRRVKTTTTEAPEIQTLNLSASIGIRGPTVHSGRRVQSPSGVLVKKQKQAGRRKKKIVKVRRPSNQRTTKNPTTVTEAPKVTEKVTQPTTVRKLSTKNNDASTKAPVYEDEDELLAAELDRLAALYGQRITYI